jgi:hypothetical protein
MKLIISFLLYSFVAIASEKIYVVPADVILARDKALLSLEKFKLKMVDRYIVLFKKKKRTIAEDRELYALDSIITGKDLNKAEQNLLEKYNKNNKKNLP